MNGDASSIFDSGAEKEARVFGHIRSPDSTSRAAVVVAMMLRLRALTQPLCIIIKYMNGTVTNEKAIAFPGSRRCTKSIAEHPRHASPERPSDSDVIGKAMPPASLFPNADPE